MKLFLFLILASLHASFAMLGKLKMSSDSDIAEYKAFTSLILQFETKANLTDPATEWHEILEKVFLLPYEDIMNYLEKSRPNWTEQLANGYITNEDELRKNFPAGESSTAPRYTTKQKIESINYCHGNIEASFDLVKWGMADPKIGHIDGFEKAYKKFEKKKFNEKYLEKIQKELPALKTAHDEIANKVTGQISPLVVLRDDYLNKLESLKKKNDVSFANALRQVKEAQDFFLPPLHQLWRDVQAYMAGALKCAELVLETKGLRFEPAAYEQKLQDKAEKKKKAAEKQAEKQAEKDKKAAEKAAAKKK